MKTSKQMASMEQNMQNILKHMSLWL